MGPQSALDAAVPGTTIRPRVGATYTGNSSSGNNGARGITVRASDDVALPVGRRVGPASATVMAKLQAPTGTTPILTAEDGASNYTLIGLEFAGNATTPNATLVQIGRLDMKLAAQTPTHITFDRVYVHADPDRGGHRGLELKVAKGQVLNSYISDFWKQGRQPGDWIFNGPGPLRSEQLSRGERRELRVRRAGAVVSGARPVRSDDHRQLLLQAACVAGRAPRLRQESLRVEERATRAHRQQRL
jgi:hypothetical protein